MISLAFVLLITISLVSGSKIQPKISNGVVATITEFPYLVSIQEINIHVCAGSLLSERWILSAARCYNSRNISNLNIEYGNTEITPGPIGTNKARISRIIAHEDFKPSPPVNDICLVESDTDIVTGFHEPFAKLVVSGGSRNFFSGTPSVHAGWGHVNQGVRTTTLQKADNAILSLQDCFDATAETQKPARNNICAVGSSVICSGDLGGPLLINGVQVGVASFRNGPVCDTVEGKYPNVYTDVSHFIDWIETNTGINYQLNVFLHRQA